MNITPHILPKVDCVHISDGPWCKHARITQVNASGSRYCPEQSNQHCPYKIPKKG